MIYSDKTFSAAWWLTTGADDLTGTDADDTFDAPLAPAGGTTLVAQQTLQGWDTLDGGAGNDTLKAELNGFDAILGAQNPTISNIEQYDLTVSADGAEGGLDLARASGYEVLQNIGSRGDLTLNNVNVNAEGDAPTIALTNVRGGTITSVNYDSEVEEVAEQNVIASNVGSDSQSAGLRLNVESGGFETLNLDVSNGVYLDLERDAHRIENLNITGSGELELEGSGSDFVNLETLDSTGYTGDLTLDVSDSEVLESVETGEGDDNVLVSNLAANGLLAVDMGEGENALWIDEADTDVALSALDFTGGVANVQTLAIDDDVLLSNDATLDLTGFDENLSTVLFDDGLDGDGNELAVTSPNADLTLASNGSFEDVDLHTNGITNLTVDVTDGNLDIDQLSGFQIDAESELQTLTLNQTGDAATSYSALDIESNLLHDVSNLQTITSTATGSASVEIDASGVDADVNSLTSVNVTSTGNDAELVLTGGASVPYFAGVQQQQTFDISGVTSVMTQNGGGVGGLFPPRHYEAEGSIILVNPVFTAGFLEIPYHSLYETNGPGILISGGSDNPAAHTNNIRSDIITALNAGNYGFTASAGGTGELLIEWDVPGEQTDITIASVTPTQGTLTFSEDAAAAVDGEAEVPMEAGTGFEALADVDVDAQDGDADVELTDVYGGVDGLTVNVTATENAWIDLNNTGVTTVVATAAHVDIDVAGDTVGNSSLQTITVNSDTAEITLADDVDSLRTLDVSNVATNVSVAASAADFGTLAAGDSVEYLIGATDTVTIDSNINAAETFSFVGDDIGNVVINDFVEGNGADHDIIDLSGFGIRQISELTIVDDGSGNAVITAGDFDGSIELTGTAAADLGAANFEFFV